MRRKTILKIMLVLIIGTVLFVMPSTAFAATGNATDIDDFWNDLEDQGDKNNLSGNTNTNTNTNMNTNTNTNTNTNKNTNTNDSIKTNTNNQYNKAGLAENTMAGVVVTVLGITAIYTYKKINEYKNI